MRGRSRESLTSLPSNLTITSPTSSPAGFAGPFSSMPAMRAPRARTEIESLGGCVVDVLDAHAEPAAAGFAELAKLFDDRDGGGGRNGEADADRAARGRQDGRVDADDLAVHVEQRTAGIAFVDGGIGLDIVVVGAGLDVAAAGRDDARRDRAAEAERVADRHHPIARTQSCRNRRISPPSGACRSSP